MAIIVGTDGSDGARAAVNEAARLAGALGERVVVVSAYAATSNLMAISPDAIAYAGDGRELADEALRLAEADLEASGVQFDMRAVNGSPADAYGLVVVVHVDVAVELALALEQLGLGRRVLVGERVQDLADARAGGLDLLLAAHGRAQHGGDLHSGHRAGQASQPRRRTPRSRGTRPSARRRCPPRRSSRS